MLKIITYYLIHFNNSCLPDVMNGPPSCWVTQARILGALVSGTSNTGPLSGVLAGGYTGVCMAVRVRLAYFVHPTACTSSLKQRREQER